MLADVIAAEWQKPAILTWLTETNFAPVSVSVRRDTDAEGLILYKGAVYELNPVCLTEEKCLALLAPSVSTAPSIVLPALWELALLYCLNREPHDILGVACKTSLILPKGLIWQISSDGFITYATGATVKQQNETIKVKAIDDETTAVKLYFCPAVHQALFDFVQEQAFLPAEG